MNLEKSLKKGRGFASPFAGALALIVVLGALVMVPRSQQVGRSGAEPMISGESKSVARPAGFSPAQMLASYGLSTSPYAGAGQTIAIVDAFDNPNVGSDLATFDAYWGLPACGGGCFTKVDQTGQRTLPPVAPLNWSVEIALDVEWAHAVAPDAHILLVEADTNSLANLLLAEQYAASHARYVSNSWGFSEFSGETADAADFTDPGVSYFAAVDDAAGETQYPATSPSVLAVGGNELTPSGTVPWTSGGGCSAYEEASSAEGPASSQAGCLGHRSTPDVSADAVGIPVYDVATGWLSTGGTSFATILWAAAATDSGAVVTQQAISSGSIPLHIVVGGTLLSTGFGNLARIPLTASEIVSMLCAEIDVTIWTGDVRGPTVVPRLRAAIR
jgi:subtilase family serine protease